MACRLFGANNYLNQRWVNVNWILRKELQWNSNQNPKFFIHENASKNVICEMTAILSRGRWIKEVGKQPHSPPCHMHKRHTCSIILPTQCLPHLITKYQGAPAATLHLHNIQHKSSQSGGTQWKLSHHDANFVITGCTLFSVCVF